MWLRRTKKPKSSEAKRALVEAKTHLREVEEREPEIVKVSEASKRFRVENHFARDLQSLFEGGAK